MRSVRALACLITLLLSGVAVGAQESGELAREIEELKKGQQQIRRELAEIKRLLERSGAEAGPARSPVEGRVFDLGDNPVVGEATAKLTLVEFSDYQ